MWYISSIWFNGSYTDSLPYYTLRKNDDVIISIANTVKSGVVKASIIDVEDYEPYGKYLTDLYVYTKAEVLMMNYLERHYSDDINYKNSFNVSSAYRNILNARMLFENEFDISQDIVSIYHTSCRWVSFEITDEFRQLFSKLKGKYVKERLKRL